MVKFAAAVDKSLQLEKKHGNQKWEELKDILIKYGYPINFESKDSLTLKLDGSAYIEVFALKHINPGNFVHIELWGYRFYIGHLRNKHYDRTTNQFSDLVDAVSYINKIYYDIKLDKITQTP